MQKTPYQFLQPAIHTAYHFSVPIAANNGVTPCHCVWKRMSTTERIDPDVTTHQLAATRDTQCEAGTNLPPRQWRTVTSCALLKSGVPVPAA